MIITGEQPTNPEVRPNQEIETKILNVDLPRFEQRLELLGAVLAIPRRVVADLNFLNSQTNEACVVIPAGFIVEQQKFNELFLTLGYQVETAGSDLRLRGKNNFPQVKLRLRQDSDRNFITGKFKDESHAEAESRGIKKRTELQAEVRDLASINKFLEDLGYRVGSRKEKYRTTYEININGAKVTIEINQSPLSKVKPWLEIEAPNEELLTQVAESLGFSKADFFPGSDNDLYRQAGFTEEELKVIKFPNGKN